MATLRLQRMFYGSAELTTLSAGGRKTDPYLLSTRSIRSDLELQEMGGKGNASIVLPHRCPGIAWV